MRLKTADSRSRMAEKSPRRIRSKRVINYKELADVKLPRTKRPQRTRSHGLYPIEVVERAPDNRVKIHYIGYHARFDEWRDESEIELLTQNNDESENEHDLGSCPPLGHPFSLYHELGTRIKQTLLCGRKESPCVRIDMPFDLLLFNGGLGAAGTQFRNIGGTKHYRIKHYRDLNPLLGDKWHYRGLNANGDYSYAVKETVEFYLRKRRPIVEYFPCSSETALCSSRMTGYMLTFCFVRGCGTPATFGRDRTIFDE